MTTDLDNINMKRVETTRLRVSHAIKMIDTPLDHLNSNLSVDNINDTIAHAINLLEAANQEMKWACQHFNWNDDVCIQIDDACAKLGVCLAILIDDVATDEYDPQYAAIEGKAAIVLLSKALATLVRWNDDTADVSEI